MIWSSRARNRSFEPVVLCFFGRIVRPPIGRENHASLLEGIAKSNLQGSDAQSTKTLQSQTHLPTRMRFQISRLAVLHGRLPKGRPFGRPFAVANAEKNYSPAASRGASAFCFASRSSPV